VRVVFADGSATDRIAVEYPLGHPRRRTEALGPLRAKLTRNLAAAFGERRAGEQVALLLDDPTLAELPVRDLVATFSP
jgi:2-methylcitrate dehydratase